MGRILIYSDSLRKVDVAFVLAGGPFSRPKEAARLYRKKYFSRIVCTGETVREDYKVLNIGFTEAEVTKSGLIRQGVPDTLIEIYQTGTSTIEEAYFIKNYCIKNNIRTGMIISSAFHTRRIHFIFRKLIEPFDTEIIICPAPETRYKENLWWKYEDGLIAWNNECMKLIYYRWKY